MFSLKRPGRLLRLLSLRGDSALMRLLLQSLRLGLILLPFLPLPLSVCAQDSFQEGTSFSFGPVEGLKIEKIQGVLPFPGTHTSVAISVSNASSSTYLILALGLRVFYNQREITSDYTITPAKENPQKIQPQSTVTLRLEIETSSGPPQGPLLVTVNLMGFHSKVGSGVNLLINPSLEEGEYDPLDLPQGWLFRTESPATAEIRWTREVFFTGNKALCVEKTGKGGQAYLEQLLQGNLFKPNTFYTFSGWVRTEDLPPDTFASLFLWWKDDTFHPVNVQPPLTGTQNWRYLSTTFKTGPNPVEIVLARGVVYGSKGGKVWFDHFSLTEGDRDGAIMLQSTPVTLEIGGATRGDLNLDRRVTVADAVLALRFLLGLASPTSEQMKHADLNNDGRLQITDVVLLLRLAVGLSLP